MDQATQVRRQYAAALEFLDRAEAAYRNNPTTPTREQLASARAAVDRARAEWQRVAR